MPRRSRRRWRKSVRPRSAGLYMIGQVAALRKETLPLSALHADVSAAGVQTLRRLAARRLPWHRPAPRRKRPG